MVKKFTIPFASQGDANDIPDALQVDGKVSFTQGFGYDYERPYDDPQAKDIAREDMNGLFKAITSAVGELQTLGASEWSNAVSYPKGAIVYFEKDLYISQVDDNQNKPPQSWVSITSIANDSLKKAANLADLTNKATARSNLGLGSSATLNKTDVLGTSTSLVATQKLVNDTKINLENSKQDKLTFVGDGPEVMRVGAFGLGSNSSAPDDLTTTQETAFHYWGNIEQTIGESTLKKYSTGIIISGSGSNSSFMSIDTNTGELYTDGKGGAIWRGLRKHYDDKNTTTDKSGFLRASGSANALTEVDAIPVGTIQAFIGKNAPNDKWLLCRGQTFSAESYPDLAQLLPDLKIPDLRGVALRGLDANRGFDPNRTLLSYQEDAIQKIYGSFHISGTEPNHSSIRTGAFERGIVTSSPIREGGWVAKEFYMTAFDSSLVTRSNPQNETVMKNVAVNFIIKAR